MTRHSPKASVPALISLLFWTSGILLFFVLASGFVATWPEKGFIVVSLLGAGLFYYGFAQWRFYQRLKCWKSVQAQVLGLAEHTKQEHTRGGIYEYVYPVIEFEYLANGKTYSSSSVSPNIKNIWVPVLDGWGNTTEIEKRWWRFLRVGQSCEVFIHPDHSERAFFRIELSPSLRAHFHGLMGSGILLFLISVFL